MKFILNGCLLFVATPQKWWLSWWIPCKATKKKVPKRKRSPEVASRQLQTPSKRGPQVLILSIYQSSAHFELTLFLTHTQGSLGVRPSPRRQNPMLGRGMGRGRALAPPPGLQARVGVGGGGLELGASSFLELVPLSSPVFFETPKGRHAHCWGFPTPGSRTHFIGLELGEPTIRDVCGGNTPGPLRL